MIDGFVITDESIIASRPPKNVVDPFRPYHYLLEQEYQAKGVLEDVAVLFLTNRECPYRCLMCDLWKNTTDETIPTGAIPSQIDFALSRLGPSKHIKLYNSGNFFDPQAIPPSDYTAIADRVRGFETVIVENHPQMCGERVRTFLDLLHAKPTNAKLEVAMGLETIHPATLTLLNKRMTKESFRRACDYLVSLNVSIRAFVLLRPPTLSESEGVQWARRSIDFAFDCAVTTVSIIPTRGGNGIMETLQSNGLFMAPQLSSLESVMRWGLNQQRGRVFADLWDAHRWAGNEPGFSDTFSRLQHMNLTQKVS